MELSVSNDVFFEHVANLLNQGRQVELRVKGDSMRPFISGGKDRVLLYKAEQYAKGDIVLARTDSGQWMLHRIVSIDLPRVILMGDGNLHNREACMESDIAGTVLQILKGNGKFVDCTGKKHRNLARIWGFFLPIRKYLLWIEKNDFRIVC